MKTLFTIFLIGCISFSAFCETAENLFAKSEEINDLQKSKQILEMLIKQFPESNLKVSALFKLGELSFLETKYNDAESYFTEILLSYKESAYYKKSLIKIIEVLYSQKRFDEALKYIERFSAEYPASRSEVFFNIKKADLHFAAGDLSNALKYYLKVLSLNPENEFKSWAFFQLGNCYLSASQFNEAYISYMTVINFFTDSVEYSQAQEMLKSIKKDGAMPEYKVAATEKSALSYFIQAGAFKNKDNALNLVKSISGSIKKNKEYKLVKLAQEDDFFKVRIGNFFSFDEANSFKKKYKIAGFVLTE